MKAGDPTPAKAEFIDSIVAEPYVRAGRIGLKQWADRNHAILSPPPINLPVRPTTNSKGGATITVDPATMGSATGSAWLGYSLNSAAWQGEKFKKEFPAEKIYRHSLREEAEGLRRVLTMANEQNLPDSKLDPSLRLLRLIDGDGMLECWILIDHADAAIAQDYIAYRAGHRPLLHAYIAKYDVHFQ